MKSYSVYLQYMTSRGRRYTRRSLNYRNILALSLQEACAKAIQESNGKVHNVTDFQVSMCWLNV